MEEAGFCGRGMMVMVASLGRGGGGGGGGGVWYHEGWRARTHTHKKQESTEKSNDQKIQLVCEGPSASQGDFSERRTLFGHVMMGFPV